MGPVLDIHLFRIKLNLVEILLYLSLLHPSIQVGLKNIEETLHGFYVSKSFISQNVYKFAFVLCPGQHKHFEVC